MTVAEAMDVVNRLCAAFRHNKATEDEIELWIEHLLSVPFEQADVAVRQIIRSPKHTFMPRLGEFLGYIDEIHNQGVPNALGGAQVQAKVEPFGIWRQDQMVAMSEEDYWRYLHDEAYRAECERRWREQWEQLRGRAS